MLICARVAALLLFTVLTGCAATYQYGNVSYNSPEEGLAAMKRDLNSHLLAVKVGSDPIKGQAVVIIPDRRRISEKGVVNKNNPSALQIGYVADVLYEGYLTLAKALEKGNVFEKLLISESYDPSINQPDADWLIWLDMKDSETVQWYFQAKGHGEKIPIPPNLGVERGQRAAAWIETVRMNAAKLTPIVATTIAKTDSIVDISGGNEVRLSENSGIYQIPVLINNVLKINIIFDSGASEVSMPPDVVLTLLRTGTIKDSDWLPGKYYKFADGSTAKSGRFRIRSIQIGNRVLQDIPCCISNSVTAPMLLGQSALKRLGKYTFDYNKGLLILQ